MSDLDLESMGLTIERAARLHRDAVAAGRTELDITSPSAKIALSRHANAMRAPRGDEPRVFVGRGGMNLFTVGASYAGGHDIAQIGTLSADGLFEPAKVDLAPRYEAPPQVAPPDRDAALIAAHSRAGTEVASSSQTRAQAVASLAGELLFTAPGTSIVRTRVALWAVIDQPNGRSKTVQIGRLNNARNGWVLLGNMETP